MNWLIPVLFSASSNKLNYTVENGHKFSDFLMIYIIDDQIVYNSDDCTLSHVPTQETLNLSISSGRLFEQLLNSQGEILARDTLLTEVWDKYGLRGSNSNLNQYLSMLRRALAAYGCENLIVTIPKIGIRLNMEIKIVRESAPAISMSEIPEVTSAENAVGHLPMNPAEPVLITPQPVRWLKKSRRMIFSVIILLLIIWFFIYHAINEFGKNNDEYSTLKLEGGCEAVVFEGLDVIERQSIDKQILQILKENNQSCTAGRRIFFDKNNAFTPNNFDRTITSVCKLDNDDHIISCDNFYYLDWRMN